MDVHLVSCLNLPEPDPDAAPLAAARAAVGLRSRGVAGDDAGVDWSAAAMTIYRSAWDYPLHHREFLDWARATDPVTDLWNPIAAVQWSAHKSYLLDLEARGLAIAPTALIAHNSSADLAGVASERGWTEVVIKPAVSAASLRTRRFGADQWQAGQDHLRALVQDGDALVQEYVPSIEGYGERALVWIDGQVTHAVRKSPRFEGQDESVSQQAVPVSAAERDLAGRAMQSVHGPLLYGRVDVAPGPDGAPVVMELELIEPSLFFAQCPAALDRYVAAIQRRLGQAPLNRP